jgi:hypothetical protein
LFSTSGNKAIYECYSAKWGLAQSPSQQQLHIKKHIWGSLEQSPHPLHCGVVATPLRVAVSAEHLTLLVSARVMQCSQRGMAFNVIQKRDDRLNSQGFHAQIWRSILRCKLTASFREIAEIKTEDRCKMENVTGY